jgi:polysaccharide pyruvyl transferase WcaK-like protein
MRRCDAMIIPGTGILDDFCERPVGMPLAIFLWCLAARAAGARVCMVSIGAGPIRHPLSRRLMVWAAKLADFRSYRDQISRDFLKDLGVDTDHDHVQPDLVFKMRTPALGVADRVPGAPLTIGVGVMGYRGWYGFGEDGAAIFAAYIEKMARFVAHLLQSGHNVRLLVGDQGDDRIAVETILKSAKDLSHEGATIVAEPISSLHDLMAQIARTDLVVATRFHNVVCSLKLGKPTISLGYARKNDVLMAQMGLGEYCDHVERFEVETLIRQLSDLVAHRSEVQARIEAQSRAFRDELERQDRHLLSEYLPA